MENSNIEWTHHTFNLAWGCKEASPGCDNCYARELSKRFGYDVWGDNPRKRMSESYWAQPLKWNKRAEREGVRERVFCSSMTDVFLNDKFIDEQRERLWGLIAQTRNLDWLLLTKHPERFKRNLPDALPFNVWLGVSVESPDYAWRADTLASVDQDCVKFLSVEPLLAPFDPNVASRIVDGVDWVIVGGESGPHARRMELDWARTFRDACVARGVAFFFKQIGGKVDKQGHDKAVLDGRRWTQFPDVFAAL